MYDGNLLGTKNSYMDLSLVSMHYFIDLDLSSCICIQSMQWVTFSISELVFGNFLVRVLYDPIDPWEHEIRRRTYKLLIFDELYYPLTS